MQETGLEEQEPLVCLGPDGRPPYGFNYSTIDAAGDVTMHVNHMYMPEPIDCAMCERPCYSNWCVPYYCGPVHTGCSEGGYKTVCKPCHDRWAKWDDPWVEYQSWIELLNPPK